MFRNYLITALRNIVRHKLYSFINIAGLGVGLACAIFIILFVRDELSYDKWVPGSANLYRVELTTLSARDRPPLAMAVVPFPMVAAMREQVPGVTGMTRFNDEQMTLTAGDRQFLEQVEVVDPQFFTLVRFPLVAGDARQVLRQPESVVLSQTAARKYFGDADPIGKFLTTSLGNCADSDTACKSKTVALKVTGIMRDLPHNSQLTGDVFLPNTSIADRYSQQQKQCWNCENGLGYVSLAPGADPQAVVAAMAPLLDRAVTPGLRKNGSALSGSQAYHVHLTPFTQVHLTSGQWAFNQTPAASWTTIYGVAAIGILILLVACFNFMNLATARAMLRAREIALRKTMGASRRQLIVQFLGEAVLMAVIALALALALAEIMLPVFDKFLRRPIGFQYGQDWALLLVLIGIAVAAGLISGSYPALVLSGFRPATVLRSNTSGQAGSGSLRTVLVVLQFAVSIGLGIAATVVFSQISFARNIDLGFRHDNIVLIGRGSMAGEKREAFAQALRANPGIAEVGLSNLAPFDNGQSTGPARVPGHSDIITINKVAISPDFPKVYAIKLVAGRMLSEARGDDRINAMSNDADPKNEGHNIVINAAAAGRLGFTPEHAVGKTILFGYDHVNIAGVLADAKVDGARAPVKPTAYFYDPKYPMGFSVRLRSGTIPQTLAFIDRTWHAFQPLAAIRRNFLDDSFDKLYLADERQGTMFGIFVGIAIFIACLGLFGLAAFTAGRRTREIGVRKVFGARTRDVVFLLLWQFSIPVLIANAIAWPIAWYYLQGWLQGFAYRIALSPIYFIGAGAVALMVAWATIFSHARRVARANPIHALRYE